MLVDLTPEALQERLRGRQGLPAATASRSRCRTSSAPTTSPRCASSRCARSPRTSRRAGIRPSLDPLSQQAVAERVLALVEPQPKSQRILRRAWRSAQRLGAEIDALWVRPAGPAADARRRRPAGGATPARRASSASTSSRRKATTSSQTVRRVAAERGSTYIFVGTPDESRPPRDLRRLAALAHGPRAARHRHPRRRRPRRPATSSSHDRAPSSRLPRCRVARGRPRPPQRRPSALRGGAGERRILVPFTAARSTPPCSTPRSASRAPRTRPSCPPTS